MVGKVASGRERERTKQFRVCRLCFLSVETGQVRVQTEAPGGGGKG